VISLGNTGLVYHQSTVNSPHCPVKDLLVYNSSVVTGLHGLPEVGSHFQGCYLNSVREVW
jgi:hypothetical protein